MARRVAIGIDGADAWQRILRTNVDSIFHVGQAVSKFMVTRGRGRIINTCSVMSERVL